MSVLGILMASSRVHAQTTPITRRLASLGIIGDQLKLPLELFGPLQHYCIEGFKLGPYLGFYYAERRWFRMFFFAV